ncbi:MAG TPA: transcription termination/antitermination NusG family protein [Planctomycetaceae bacterium]|nr:transcription termination/antitermination NusG family protein [Planctomycetaceae bacterium]
MPILAAEPDLFPVDLLDREDWGVDSDRQWWALYTRSRREKELMRRLRGLEIPFYGPTIEQRGRTPGGRIRTSYIPLFPNYVFVFGNASQRYDALTTNCVSRDIPVTDTAQLVGDLRRLRQMLLSGVPIVPESQLEPGARVRVRSGPLTGQEGTVLRRRGETRLLVAVRFLQQGASVQIDECDLEKL